MIKKIDHIGIAVKDLNAQIKYYSEVLGLTCIGIEKIKEQRVKVASFSIGETRIELIEPMAEDNHIVRFLESRGEGIHHIAYQVSDIKSQLQKLERKNIRLIDKQPRQGANENKIAFLHPKSTFGVLTELCEQNPEVKK